MPATPDYIVTATPGTRRSNGGRVKTFTTLASTIGSVATMLLKLSDIQHALAATIIFAFFAVYVATDVLYWRGYPAVWLLGPLTIGVAAYWWLGFMAIHGVPPEPMLPAAWHPPLWGYFAMAAWIVAYAVWDILDARVNHYRDEKWLVAGALMLVVGVGVCLFRTLQGPAAGGAA